MVYTARHALYTIKVLYAKLKKQKFVSIVSQPGYIKPSLTAFRTKAELCFQGPLDQEAEPTVTIIT